MKVLYIGVYKDGTGYGQAAIDYIMAMDSVGIDVVPRAIRFNRRNAYIPKRILELEQKDSKGCDAVIQHILPHYMEYDGSMKNIGLYASETDSIKYCEWPTYLNMMDEVWVINNQMKECAINSGVKKPIRVIPHATNLDKFSTGYDKIIKDVVKDTFSFYFIGESNRRKNVASLLTAFHTEFGRYEPVSLVLKMNGDLEENALSAEINKYCASVKEGFRVYNNVSQYKKEFTISKFCRLDELYGIHASCDCFVMPSYGEAWCLPAMDAMGFGKTPIVSANTGFLDYITDEEGWLVKCNKEPCYGMMDSINGLYTSKENWWKVQIDDLRRCMREAYENKDLRMQKAIMGSSKIMDFSYEKIGNLIKESL